MEADAAPDVLGVYGGDGSVSAWPSSPGAMDGRWCCRAARSITSRGRRLNRCGDRDRRGDHDRGQRGRGQRGEVSAVEETAADLAILALNAVSVGAESVLIDERCRPRPRGARRGRRGAARLARSRAAGHRARRSPRPRVVAVGSVATKWARPPMQRAHLEEPVLDVIHHARGTRLRAIARCRFVRG